MPSLAHEQLLYLLDLTHEVIDEIPAEPRPGSIREVEHAAVLVDKKYRPGRVALLDELNADLQIGAANVAPIVGGLADCLQTASWRDNGVNKPLQMSPLRAAVPFLGSRGDEAGCDESAPDCGDRHVRLVMCCEVPGDCLRSRVESLFDELAAQVRDQLDGLIGDAGGRGLWSSPSLRARRRPRCGIGPTSV